MKKVKVINVKVINVDPKKQTLHPQVITNTFTTYDIHEKQLKSMIISENHVGETNVPFVTWFINRGTICAELFVSTGMFHVNMIIKI